MSDINWPPFLPLPSISLSADMATPTAITAMETGRVRARRRFEGLRKTFNVSWEFSLTEYDIFVAFFNHAINGGVTVFNLTVPGIEGLAPQAVRFASSGFREMYVPHERWMVQATLVSELIESSSEAWLYLYEFTSGDLDSYLLLSADIHELVHVTLPDSI